MDSLFRSTLPTAPNKPVGAIGTKIFGGYIYEEFLSELRTYQRSLIFDQMRRSEPPIGQLISVSQIASEDCTAFIAPKNQNGELTSDIEKQLEFINFCLFENLNRSFDEIRQDVYTFDIYGFSLFEGLWKNEVTKFGKNVCLKDLLWRSPKTIDEWHVDDDEQLNYIVQRVYSDGQHAKDNIKIPATNAFLFSLEREGNLFEGISPLRRVFGFYQAKRELMQQLVIGCNKYSIPLPIMKGPTDQQDNLIWSQVAQALEDYRGGRNSYLLIPKMFEIEFPDHKFDPSKLVSAMEYCDRAMFAESLAYFLDMKDSGSYSLGSAVMKFFFMKADKKNKIIANVFNRRVIPFLLYRNGFKDCLVELRFSKAGKSVSKEFAETIATLTNTKHLRPDDAMEEFLREHLGLPNAELTRDEAKEKAMEDMEKYGLNNPDDSGDNNKSTPNQTPSQEDDNDPSDGSFSKKKGWEKPNKLINKGEKSITETFRRIVNRESQKIIKQLMKQWKEAKDKIDKRVLPEIAVNKKKIRSECYKEMLGLYEDSRINAQNEIIAKDKTRKASADLADIAFAKKAARVYSDADAFLMANLLGEEIENTLGASYISHSVDAESFEELESTLVGAVEDIPKKKEVVAQTIISAAKAVNTARLDLYDEIENEIESYTFLNENPKTAICQYLNGKTFNKDELRVPPLHWGCKSYINPNMKRWRNNPKIDKISITKEMREEMNLSKKPSFNCGPCCG